MGEPRVITRVLKSGRRMQERRSEWCNVKKTGTVNAGFEDIRRLLAKEYRRSLKAKKSEEIDPT